MWTEKGCNWDAAYGTHIIIESKDAAEKVVRHLYAHLNQKMVHVGASVLVRQQIAKSGNTGRSTDLHLHYEERVSPFAYDNHRNPQFNKSNIVNIHNCKLQAHFFIVQLQNITELFILITFDISA
ncbi:unnamed protein product [Rotaria magnacalcarata]|uniref:M23ase beta-sheet core domain-containing protein n=1 Tax=Rotaria magnacalcarata TaxID=392030 RepID=A0A816QCW9_9BILA|nr:unnamed protein product [Rotaria magnacalcarata]CAF1683521.1 unnamed protein product [Rotaria magnacalcarata]CAF2058029.1 unnamed protein product [Rotaria magnacalcarata]CAF4545714.1 unnamed protein product [Rotaria magnacalcarata]CAF4609148.1 unnamed protein product [Rotaria magnacalcarata]